MGNSLQIFILDDFCDSMYIVGIGYFRNFRSSSSSFAIVCMDIILGNIGIVVECVYSSSIGHFSRIT